VVEDTQDQHAPKPGPYIDAEKGNAMVSKSSIDLPLPGWPPVLHEAWAAAYLSLGASTFRAAVVPDVLPVQLTPGRIGWRIIKNTGV
jgi:hypothetical protein